MNATESSGIVFNFYLKEIMSDISNLPVECTLACCKVSINRHAGDLVLDASTSEALQYLLSARNTKLYTMSLQESTQKS